jgi:hypothetical protein
METGRASNDLYFAGRGSSAYAAHFLITTSV